MRVLWLHPFGQQRDYNQVLASVWIRCLQLIPYFEDRGLECIVNKSEENADIAVFVRWQDRAAYELARHLKARGQKIVFDLCVNYFDETDVPSIGLRVTRKHVEECLRMASVADVVSCASEYIARRARDFHPNVEFLPDSIDRRHFRFTKSPSDFYQDRLQAIWSGTALKARELEPILPLLKQHNIKLVIVSDRQPHLTIDGWFWKKRFPYHFVRWDYETFPKQIVNGDICVANRPVDTPYNLGHSVFKIGVFMAQGIPAIASPVPSYEKVLKNGINGRLCFSLDEWEEALSMTVTDRHILARWSQEARKTMRSYWTESIIDRYFSLFRRLRDSSQ